MKCSASGRSSRCSRGGFDQQQGCIHEQRGALTKAETQVAVGLHTLCKAKKVPAFGSRRHRGLKLSVILDLDFEQNDD